MTRSYDWADVRRVTTSCTRGSKGGWDPDYELTFSDGRSLALMGGTAPVMKFGPQIAKALHGKAFRFDSAQVAPGCDVGDLGMLVTRP